MNIQPLTPEQVEFKDFAVNAKANYEKMGIKPMRAWLGIAGDWCCIMGLYCRHKGVISPWEMRDILGEDFYWSVEEGFDGKSVDGSKDRLAWNIGMLAAEQVGL